MSKSYVLDASAVLDFAEDGPGGKRVEPLFKDALLQRTRVLMSVLNLCEVFYHSWQQQGEDRLNLSQSLQAGGIRARHKIPSVDCIAAGLAILHQAVLVTSDRDFEKLGRPIEVL